MYATCGQGCVHISFHQKPMTCKSRVSVCVCVCEREREYVRIMCVVSQCMRVRIMCVVRECMCVW